MTTHRTTQQKKSRSVATAVLVCVLSATSAHASLVIVLVTPQRIVAASDSRMCIYAEGVRAEGSGFVGQQLGCEDTHRKVFFAGPFVLAATGQAQGNGDRSPDVVGAWQSLDLRDESAAQRVDRFLAALKRKPIHALATTLASVGIFKHSGALPDGLVFQLRHEPGQPVAEVIERQALPRLPIVAVIGFDDANPAYEAVIARLQAAVEQLPDEARMVDLARGAIAEIAAITPKVGGPVHIAAIDAKGSRWIQP